MSYPNNKEDNFLFQCVCVSCLVVSDCVQPHRPQPIRPLRAWSSIKHKEKVP